MSGPDAAARIERLLSERVAVRLREPGAELGHELRAAIVRAEFRARTSSKRTKPNLRPGNRLWLETCLHCDTLATLLPGTEGDSWPVLDRLSDLMEGRSGSAFQDIQWFDSTESALEILLRTEGELLESLLPLILRSANRLAGRDAGLDELIRNGLCAVGGAVSACQGLSSVGFRAHVLEPLRRSMFLCAGVPAAEPRSRREGSQSSLGEPLDRGGVRDPQGGNAVGVSDILDRLQHHSTAEVCKSMGSRDDMRAVFWRFVDSMARGDDPPLGRLVANLPLMYRSLLALQTEHLLDPSRFAAWIEKAQHCWAQLHPEGTRRYPDESPSQIARRWLYPSPSLREDTCEVQSNHVPCWNELPPLSDAQRKAELNLLISLIPFVVHRSIAHSDSSVSLSTPFLMGLRAALGATVVPRSGRVPWLDYTVLQRIDNAARCTGGRAGSLWWVDEVPDAVELHLLMLARAVSKVVSSQVV